MHLINVGLIELNCKVVHLAGAWLGGKGGERAHAFGAFRIRKRLQMCFGKGIPADIYKFASYCIWSNASRTKK